MYSIVMLTAMSAGADVTPPAAPTPHIVVAPVASGCFGVVTMGCSGSCYGSSCHGSSCHGSSCHGSGFLGLRSSGFLGLRSSCHGCTGCSGYAFHSSCHGSCYGSSCHGYSCFGSSCHGSCHGVVSYGSTWGPPVGMLPYTLHGYNTGVSPAYGPSYPIVIGSLTNPISVYGRTTNPNLPPVMVIPVAPMVKPMSSDGTPMGANLKFKVPADAKLFVDGKETPGTGTERAFFTPPLEKGKKFFYDVEVEYKKDGKTTKEVTQVVFEAGANVTLELPKTAVASK